MKNFTEYFESIDYKLQKYYHSNIKFDKEFETELSERDCFVEVKSDNEYTIKNTKVYWGIVLKTDKLNSCLSGIDIYVKKIEFDLIITDAENDVELKNEHLVIESDKIKNDISAIDVDEFNICPTDLYFKYDKMTCDLSF
jgi:hypothetical protein